VVGNFHSTDSELRAISLRISLGKPIEDLQVFKRAPKSSAA